MVGPALRLSMVFLCAQIALACTTPTALRWSHYQQAGEEAYDHRDLDAAHRDLRAAYAQASRLAPDDPRRVVSLIALARVERAKGETQHADDRLGRAVRLLEEQIDRSDLLREALLIRARLRRDTDRLPEAAEDARRALDLASGDDRRDPDIRLDRARALYLLGTVHALEGDPDAASTRLSEALELLPLPGPEGAAIETKTLAALAHLRVESDRPADAVSLARAAVEVQTLSDGAIRARLVLAGIDAREGRSKAGEARLSQSMSLLRNRTTPDFEALAGVVATATDLFLEPGRVVELQEAAETAIALSARVPSFERVPLGVALTRAGQDAADARHPEAADALLRHAQEVLDGAVSSGDPRLLEVTHLRASLAYRLERTAEAAELNARSIRIGERGLPETAEALVSAYLLRAAIETGQGRNAAADMTYARALSTLAEGQANPRLQARVLRQRGQLAASRGRLAAAQGHLEEAVALLEGADDAASREELAAALSELGFVQVETGDREVGERTFQRLLQALPDQEQPPRDFLTSYAVLAQVMLDRGAPEEAETLLVPVVERARRSGQRPPPALGLVVDKLVRALGAQEKYRKAEEYGLFAVEVIEDTAGPDNPKLAAPLQSLAYTYFRQGRNDRAQYYYERAVDLMRSNEMTSEPGYANATFRLGTIYQAQLEDARAIPLLEAALTTSLRAGGTPEEIAQILGALARSYEMEEDFAQAAEAANRLVKVLEQMDGVDQERIGEARKLQRRMRDRLE